MVKESKYNAAQEYVCRIPKLNINLCTMSKWKLEGWEYRSVTKKKIERINYNCVRFAEQECFNKIEFVYTIPVLNGQFLKIYKTI
jgi:hypothetical protein